jgi:hypothetical protein
MMWNRVRAIRGRTYGLYLGEGMRLGDTAVFRAKVQMENGQLLDLDIDAAWDELDDATRAQLDNVTWQQIRLASRQYLDSKLSVTRWSTDPSNAFRVLGDPAQPTPLLKVRGRRSFVMLLGVLPRAFVQEFGSEMVADFVAKAREENGGYGLWLLRELFGVVGAAVCVRLWERSPMKRYVAVGNRAVNIGDYIPTGHCCGHDPCRCAALED